ncbi:hemerythrin domain-containing protein [Roseimaritima sediminicola]|uniref:hemerythrin domain-containing protein n=1 Tax=Roseimaritima sediminicola TaxID=2662066 RepID=UPI0012984220|nr:hemerythrin domain-containing protein [Roseimaritima sediminicola]
MSEEQPGSRVTINAAFLQEIKADHQQLKELLDRLRNLSQQPQAMPNHGREYVDLLQKLCDQLALHFTLEEAYGYFEDALESSPRLDQQAGMLRAQHADLFVLARDLADVAGQEDLESLAVCEKLAEQFHAFDNSLKAHESAELNLILAALEEDLGVGD